jgi:starvation-inducible DNA-binding protein
MADLVENMKVVLADTYAFVIKAENYHWNVEGPNFPQYHKFFGKLYKEVDGSIDVIAEHIRAIGAYAPGSLSRFQELTTIEDELNIPEASEMVKRIGADNDKVIASLTTAYKSAEEAEELGLANFLQDRIDIHKKHGWMIKATSKV